VFLDFPFDELAPIAEQAIQQIREELQQTELTGDARLFFEERISEHRFLEFVIFEMIKNACEYSDSKDIVVKVIFDKSHSIAIEVENEDYSVVDLRWIFSKGAYKGKGLRVVVRGLFLGSTILEDCVLVYDNVAIKDESYGKRR